MIQVNHQTTKEQDKRNHKVKCDYGINDYWNYYKNTSEDPVTEEVYKKVLYDYLKINRNYISKFGRTFTLPKRLGRIEIRKFKQEIKVNQKGEIENNLTVNWKATKQLWKENKMAKEKKILIRYTNEHTKGYAFRVYYFKNSANFKNKSIYSMQVNRQLRRDTSIGILNKTIDSFLISKSK